MTVGKKLHSGSLLLKVILVNVLLIFIKFASSHQIDTVACILRNNQIGKCVKFEECRSAIALSQKGVRPEFCSVEGRIVCCRNDIRQTEGVTQNQRRPSPGRPPSNSPKRQNDVPGQKHSNPNLEDAYESDLNIERKKHSVGNSGINTGSGDNQRKKNYQSTYDIVSSDYDVNRKPVRRPNGNNKNTYNDFSEDGSFVPPGVAKKKQYGVEKTTESEYYYEYNTKRPNRGPSRKGSSKHNSYNYEGSDQPKRVDEVTTGRNNWYNQEGKRTTNNYEFYEEPNDYQSGWFKPESTTRRNKITQPTYTTTKRDEYFGSGPGNNQQGNNYYGTDENFDVRPVKRPYKTSTEPNYQGRPTSQQGSRPHENHRPNTKPQSNRRMRVSERKCQEYSKGATRNITGLPLTSNPDPVTIPIRKCIQAQQLIVGGENTTIGEFPHMAAIGFHDRNKRGVSWNCGGSLISEQYVMTAGHCALTTLGRPVKVRLGEYNLIKNDDGAHPVEYGVVEIITHPEYRPPSKYNDIALLKLSRQVTFFEHIRPACLYSENTFSETKAIATGWGRMYYEGGASEILQKVVLSIVDNNLCNRLYKTNAKTEVLSRGIVESQMCAGELTGGKDTCQGDSGGPLSITSTKCVHHIVGITSFGKSCALPNSTGVYTRVSSYVSWIESVVWPEVNT